MDQNHPVMKSIFTLVLFLLVSFFSSAQSETEPNNSFETANAITPDAPLSGSVNDLTSGGIKIDEFDYYRAVFTTDGTVRINISGTNTHTSNGYLYLYVYDSRKSSGQLLGKYVGNTSSVANSNSIIDQIDLHGRAADTLYFRLQTSGKFSYTISYSVIATSTNDVEPNDLFDQSLPITFNEIKEGHIGYRKNGTDDADDYYVGVMPTDGTLRIIVEGQNQNGGNGYMYMYVYDARKGNGTIFQKYIANSSSIKADSTIYDTIYIHGRAADTVYFRMISSGAFRYTVKYDVVDTSPNDAEPNDIFSQALGINHLEEKVGHIGYIKKGSEDASDYYRTVLPFDGTLKIMVRGQNRNSGNGYMYMYVYDRRQGNGTIAQKYIANSSSIKRDSTIFDTIYIHGRAADTVYFRMTSSGAFSYALKYDMVDTTLNDVEPNDNFDTPIGINQLEVKKGHIGYVKNGAEDASDYYKTVIPIDGTLKIYIQGTNQNGGNGYMYLYGYDRRKGSGQIFGTYVSGSSSIKADSTIYDTLTVYGVLADTFYFRMISSGAFSYQLSYNTEVNAAFDPEPNNTFDQSVAVREGITQNGQIGYTLGGIEDANDYYKTVFPADGTMKLVVQGTNNNGSNGYMYMYGYDRRKGSGAVFQQYIVSSSVPNAATINDTIFVYGRAADTFYYRMTSSGAFNYQFSYQMVDTSINDEEPNDVFDQSLAIELLEKKQGHIGYEKGGAGDAADYYRTVLPIDGTLKIMVQGRNQWSGNGYLYINAYDRRKGSGQILAKYVANSSSIKKDSTIYDTIYIFGRAADTVYFRMISSGAFSYRLKYDIVDTTENDIEPNDVFDQSLSIAHQEEKKGHIGYLRNGSDDALDYYKTVLPTNGTLQIFVQGKNRGGGNGYLYINGYDRRKGSGQILAKYVSNSSAIKADSTIYDTIYLHGRAADTTYFRISSSGSFSYSLKYQMIDTGDNDLEPNDTYTEALPIAQHESKTGHIGYVKAGVDDANDYYVTSLPYDGTLKIFVQGTNKGSGNGYMYMYGYDRRKTSGTILSQYVAGSSIIKKDSTIYDTILVHCRAADTTYFRMTSSGSFKYTISYQMVDTSINDAEPNNSFATAEYMGKLPTDSLLPAKKGHIGYVANGVTDTDDYYKVAVPAAGSIQIIMTVTNTRASNGWVRVYGYNQNRTGNLLNRYIKGTTTLPGNSTTIDTININCANIDSFYYRITSSGCFAYSFSMRFIDNDPKAKFVYNQAGSLHEFVNESTNANSYIWKVDNSIITTNTAPPLLSYRPGGYDIRLIAKNSVCNFIDTAFYKLLVRGLDRFTPASGGEGNVEFTAYGGGFHTGMKVYLKQGANVYSDSLSKVNQYGNIFSAIVDMHNAPTGIYDVEIVTNDTSYFIPGGYRSEALISKLKAEIIGRDIIRRNTNTNYSVRVHNQGNTMAGLVEVYILFPPYMQVNVMDTLTQVVNYQFDDINIDTLPLFRKVTTDRGYPINGNLYSFYIAGIPANGFRDLTFIVNSGVGKDKIYTWVQGPLSGSEYKSWFDPCNKAKVKLVMDALVDGLSTIPIADCAVGVAKLAGNALYSAANWLLGNGAPSAASLTKTALGTVKDCAGEALAAAGFAPGIAFEIADVLADLAILGSNIDVNVALVTDACADEPEPEEEEKPVDVRTSFDPNAKSGPAGYTAAKYILGSQKLVNYTLFFENQPTASLPAQEVIILDTLDKTRFDLSSFRALSFAIGSNHYNIPLGAIDYSIDVPFNSQLNVRLSINLDTITGIMKAHFKSIDTQTGAVTDDPLAGFLPPNTNSPNGEGYISFSIDLLDGLPHGTVVRNKASIIFDTNEPIVTDEWMNTLDRNMPSSQISGAYQLNDSTVVIKATGTDAASGFRNFKLFVSANGDAYKYYFKVSDSALIYGSIGTTFNYYVVGVDSVGNQEQKTPSAEGTFTITDPLVITLGNISATNDGTRNRIDWITLHEDRGDRFEIEKSAHGRDFSHLATVQAKGIAGDYFIYDNTPEKGRTWYRLKLKNADGKYSYSKVVSAYMVSNGGFVMEAYPNPVSNRLNITLHGAIDGRGSISVFDMMGKQVMQMPVNRNRISLDISSQPRGNYIIKYTDSKNAEVIKITKQ